MYLQAKKHTHGLDANNNLYLLGCILLYFIFVINSQIVVLL